LISDVIANPKRYLDNLFADTWKKLNFNSLITGAGFTKRSGIGITEALFVLLLWKWLNMSSIAMFSKKALGTFSKAKKDVMYDLLKREEINGRELNTRTAKAVYQQRQLVGSRLKVLVLDDSIKTRRGKKMEGVSSHFDHVTGRHVMGQQVLTLGLATEAAFLPLDSQIYISQTKARKLIKPYKDGRSVVAKRYREATTQCGGPPNLYASRFSHSVLNPLCLLYRSTKKLQELVSPIHDAHKTATSTNPATQRLAELCEIRGAPCHRAGTLCHCLCACLGRR